MQSSFDRGFSLPAVRLDNVEIAHRHQTCLVRPRIGRRRIRDIGGSHGRVGHPCLGVVIRDISPCRDTLVEKHCKARKKERTINAAMGAQPGFVITPGVCKSSMGSASGNNAVPSTLRVRARVWRAMMACRDGAFLKPLALHRFIHNGGLLRKTLHLLGGGRLAGTCSRHRIAVDKAVGRVWGRGGERTGGGGACDGRIDSDGIGERCRD